MEDALDPKTSVWEQIHGIHEIPKGYVPPFMKGDHDAMQEANEQSPEDIQNKIYEFFHQIKIQNTCLEENQVQDGHVEMHAQKKQQIS